MNANSLVSILPLRPRVASSLSQIFFTIFSAWFVSRLTDKKFLLPWNIKGLKGKGDPSAITAFKELLEKLGVTDYEEWADLEISNDEIQEVIEIFERKGKFLIEREAEVLVCYCGALEIERMSQATTYATQTIMIKDPATGRLSCSICGYETKSVSLPSVYIDFSSGIDYSHYQVFPENYTTSFKAHVSELSRPLRITRNRPENPSFVFRGKTYFIDIDVLWPLFGYWVRKSRSKMVEAIIANHDVIKQLAMIALYQTTIESSDWPISFFVLPRVKFKTRRPLTELEPVELLKQYSPKVIRAFYLLGMQWGRKEAIVESKLLHWTNISLSKMEQIGVVTLQEEPFSLELKEVVGVKGSDLRLLYDKIRKEKQLSDKERRIIRVLS